eukprot:CFRG8362T1
MEPPPEPMFGYAEGMSAPKSTCTPTSRSAPSSYSDNDYENSKNRDRRENSKNSKADTLDSDSSLNRERSASAGRPVELDTNRAKSLPKGSSNTSELLRENKHSSNHFQGFNYLNDTHDAEQAPEVHHTSTSYQSKNLDIPMVQREKSNQQGISQLNTLHGATTPTKHAQQRTFAHPQRVSKPSGREMYDILGVPPDADIAAIRRAYKRKAKEYHPDRNPVGAQMFLKLSAAFQVLEDPVKRNEYDKYGTIDKNNKSEKSPSARQEYARKMFNEIFGPNADTIEGFAPPTRTSRRHSRMIHHVHRVSLLTLYSGAFNKIAIQRTVICKACQGVGGGQGALVLCDNCAGKGVLEIRTQIAPSRYQQASQTCPKCQGNGELRQTQFCCQTCAGKRVIKERNILTIHIERGMEDGEKIILEGQGDEQVGNGESDIVVVLQQTENLRFRRKGNDLFTSLDIMLVEALCGFTRQITFLDNNKISVTCKPGQVTSDGLRRCIPGLGMPIRGQPGKHGRLIIEFTTLFPADNFTNEAGYAMLEGILPPRPRLFPPDKENSYPGEFVLEELDEELSDSDHLHTPTYGKIGNLHHSSRGNRTTNDTMQDDDDDDDDNDVGPPSVGGPHSPNMRKIKSDCESQ